MWIQLLQGVVFAATGAEAIRENCGEEWPDNYVMQEFCIEQQTEAAARMEPIVNRVSANETSAEYRVLAKCADEWRKGSGYNYMMVEFCWNQQTEAMQRLRNK